MATTNNSNVRPTNLQDLINQCLRDEIFQGGVVNAYPTLRDNESRVVVVFGENASGKSLVLNNSYQHIGSYEETRVETFSVSMRMRTSESMGQGIMYMRERNSSTGASSVHAVTGVFRNAVERPHPVWIMLDEAELGLSDRYAASLGAYIAAMANTLPDHIRGVMVVSHSRVMLSRLLRDLETPPHEISMGENQSLAEYLARPFEVEATVDDLEALLDRAHETRRFVRETQEAAKAAAQKLGQQGGFHNRF